MFHDLYATESVTYFSEVKHYYLTYICTYVRVEKDLYHLKVTTTKTDLSDLEHAGKDVNK